MLKCVMAIRWRFHHPHVLSLPPQKEVSQSASHTRPRHSACLLALLPARVRTTTTIHDEMYNRANVRLESGCVYLSTRLRELGVKVGLEVWSGLYVCV